MTPWTVTTSRLLSDVTFGVWNWMRVRLRLWQSPRPRYIGWHLIPKWLLGSIYSRFPELLLNGFVPWGSPGKYAMIGCFLADAFVVLCCQFWSTVLQCDGRLSIHDTHRKLLDRIISGASFLTVGVFECDFVHCRSVAVLCMLYNIRCNPMHPL